MRFSDLKPGDRFTTATSLPGQTLTKIDALDAIEETQIRVAVHPDTYVELAPATSALEGDVDLTRGRACIKIRGEWLEVYGPDSPDPVNRLRLPC